MVFSLNIILHIAQIILIISMNILTQSYISIYKYNCARFKLNMTKKYIEKIFVSISSIHENLHIDTFVPNFSFVLYFFAKNPFLWSFFIIFDKAKRLSLFLHAKNIMNKP